MPSYKLFNSLILALGTMSRKRLCVARGCSYFTVECGPGSGGIMPARPFPFPEWLRVDTASDIKLSSQTMPSLRKPRRQLCPGSAPPCHALKHCWGPLLMEKMNPSRKLLAIWGCLFTQSLPGNRGAALREFLLYFTENIRFN